MAPTRAWTHQSPCRLFPSQSRHLLRTTGSLFCTNGDLGFSQSDIYTCYLADWLRLAGRDRIFREIFSVTATVPLQFYRNGRAAAGKALSLCGGTNVRQSKLAVFNHRSTDRCDRSSWLQSLSGSKATGGSPDKCRSERREDPGKVASGHR
jgi:hypothetical protein